MRERILAVVGAICLVAVAVLVRQWLSDRGDDAPKGSRSSGGGAPVVACTADLAEVCAALAAAGGIAADPPELDGAAAAAPDGSIDAWITWDPAPQLAGFDANGRSATAVWTEVEVLGTAPLAVAATGSSLTDACGGSVTWTCLAEAGASADPLEVGVGRPATAEGAARLLPLARALSDGDDPDTVDALALRSLLAGPRNGQRPAATMATLLATRPGEVELVVAGRGLLDATAATARGRERDVQVAVPEPGASVAVVVAGRTAGVAERIAGRCDDAAEALATAGLTTTCAGGDTIDDGLAGFLWQVRKGLR